MRVIFPILSLALSVLATSSNAETKRLVVLDSIDRGLRSRILLLDAESGSVLAERDAEAQGIMGISPQGDVVGVISLYSLAGRAHRSRAEFYRTNDELTPLESGYLPVGRTPLQTTGGHLYFTADGAGVIIQRMESYLDDHKPHRYTVNDCWLYPMLRELDEQGTFKRAWEPVKVPRCTSVNFLRVADWPRAVVWNRGVRALYTVNFDTGQIESRVGIYDDPILQTFDPTYYEGGAIAEHVRRRLVSPGKVHTWDGLTGYYVPQQPTGNPPKTAVGYLRKIDLTANPPKIVLKSEEPQPDLRAGVAALAGAGLFVVRDRHEGSYAKPSNRIRVFDARDFAFINEIELPSVTGIQHLVPSDDEKQLFALSPSDAKIAVVDVQTGQEVRTLDLEQVADHPAMVFALPGGSGG